MQLLCRAVCPLHVLLTMPSTLSQYDPRSLQPKPCPNTPSPTTQYLPHAHSTPTCWSCRNTVSCATWSTTPSHLHASHVLSLHLWSSASEEARDCPRALAITRFSMRISCSAGLATSSTGFVYTRIIDALILSRAPDAQCLVGTAALCDS